MNIPRRSVPYLLLLAPAALILCAVLLYPLLYALRLSLFEFSLARPYLGETFVGLRNYVDIFTRADFWRALGRTLLLTGVAVNVELALGFGLALLMNRPLAGITVFRTMAALPVFLTPVAVGYTWKFILSTDFGVLNHVLGLAGFGPYSPLGSVTAALPTIMVVDIWQHTPFALFLCLAGLKGLPPEPFEAARIDGATPWQVVRHLTIPLLRPVILVILAIRSYDVLKTFDTVYVLTGGGPADASTVLSVLLYREAFVQLNTGYAAALSWVVLLVTLGVVVAYFVALRGGGE